MKSFVLLGFAVLQAINGEIQIYNDVNKISFKSTDSFSLKCNYTVNDNIKILLGTNDVASCTTTFGTCSASDSRFTAAATISTTLPTPPNEFVVTATAGFSTALCGTYTCQGSTGSPSDTVDISWNKFSTANTSLTPLELSAGESGALNITTDCLFPASDQSITINWYKTYQDGQADEALDSTKDSNIEIYNETQRSTCTDTCGSEEDAKLVIGCRYTPPSNPGKGFQLRAEVIHKDYIDKLYWTFTGTYYVEVCDCKVLKIVWSVLFIVFSTGSGAWILYVLFAVPKARKWLTEKLCAPTHLCMIGWIFVSFVYSIIAVILYNILVCKDESSEADCWPVYVIIGIVVKGGDVAVSLLALLAFLNG